MEIPRIACESTRSSSFTIGVERLSISARPERLMSERAERAPFGGSKMKYLCLIYDEEAKMATMSKSDADAFMGEYFAFTEGIKKSGHYVGGEALKPVNTATTVRVRNGK